ncbi:hypothetical protein [Moraxella oblonga]|uniref:hypothetical protein n=1 Tax=Moraxella oblonga TaxID=200413 RepID=UPI00082A6479|nr:hypothetical protein [Moraxella oblonga]
MNKSIHSSVQNDTHVSFKANIDKFIHKFQTHDAVIITALRDDFYKYKQPILKNNQALYSALFALGYPMIELASSYIKDYQKVLNLNDNFFMGSYLVINRFDKPDFVDNLAKLANHYGQPHIFVIQGGKTPKGHLLITKEKGKLTFGQIVNFPEGYELIGNPEFFKPYLNRDFYFTGVMNDSKITNSNMEGIYQPANWLGRWAVSSMGKCVLKEVGILSF